MKTYIGIIRDHSGSMRPLVNGAINDYNLTIEGIKDSVRSENQSAYVSVIECGVGYRGEATKVESRTPLERLKNLTSYSANGGSTPLWDSVGLAISDLESTPNVDQTDAFLVMVITDGEENSSRLWNLNSIRNKINSLQATDKWTFVFRVPRGSKARLVNMGIPSGNIMEWEQTEKELVQSTQATVSAVKSYFASRSQGVTRSSSFFTADLSNVTRSEISSTMADVTNTMDYVWVDKSWDGRQIRDFCQDQFGSYSTGRAYYQLTKPEKVQDNKRFCIRDDVTKKIYEGTAARQLLGLPTVGMIKLAPGANSTYTIFVQSNSVNRKLVGGTYLLYLK